MVTFSSINTKNKMYDQMTIQGLQLGNQIRANLENDQVVLAADELTSIGDNRTLKSILDDLGKDDSIIYVGILDHNNKVIGTVISHVSAMSTTVLLRRLTFKTTNQVLTFITMMGRRKML